MHSTVVSSHLQAEEIASLQQFIAAREAQIGYRPVSDETWAELGQGPVGQMLTVQVMGDDGRLTASAHASTPVASPGAVSAWTVATVISSDDPATVTRLTTQVLAAALSAIIDHGGVEVTWLVQAPTAVHDSVATVFGLRADRRLHQMRMALPTGIPFDIETRAFDPERDLAEWVRVNNRAFAWNPEQGSWTEANVRSRMNEPWFDPAGFLIHEREGRIAGFCWTKIHESNPTDGTSRLGEIYVIAVDPDFHGAGLGRALTLAGLDSLARRGITVAMLFVDADNVAAIRLYDTLGFAVHRTDCLYHGRLRPDPDADQVSAGAVIADQVTTDELPRWSVVDVHESMTARTFQAAMEQVAAETARLVALFDQLGIRALSPRPVTAADGDAADQIIEQMNAVQQQETELAAYIHSFVSTNSYDEQAQALANELQTLDSQLRPLMARLVDWVASLGVDALASVSTRASEHIGPLRQLALRAEHQMSEIEEGLYAELSLSGSAGWTRLHSDVTSQLHGEVTMPDGAVHRLPMAAVRGLANDIDPRVRQAGYDAELAAWPTVAVSCAAAMNGIKGEANSVNRRRNWASPLDASLYANNISRPTFDAMQSAIHASLDDFRGWMRNKAGLHGYTGGLKWRDLMAPLPTAAAGISWERGLEIVRNAFRSYGGTLGGLVDRAIDEQWIDAAPRDGKRGGAFCMPFVDDRSLVFLNWNGSVDATQTTAHELGHAYHNTQLAHRTPLQRRLPMALAETASIFCETLVVEEGLQRLEGAERLALLDVDLQGANQVVVDIHSRFLFETELFARRQRRTLGISELNELMLAAQDSAYGDGLDQTTAHPYMWAVKPHYYGSHFYNWPYTYGLLFGLGLFARYQRDPEHFRNGYDDVLSRVGMNTAEELGRAFDIDVTDESFWTASLDVLRARMVEYARLATGVRS